MEEPEPRSTSWSHARLRRLEAEAIRDALLFVSGQLQASLYGPPVGGNSDRRSVYVRVRRNQLDPFLRIFDFPEPYTATGRRDATNVPAQSLTMMNDPRVRRAAEAWAERLLADESIRSDLQRAQHMLTMAFGRPPLPAEVRRALDYAHDIRRDVRTTRQLRDARQQETKAEDKARGSLLEKPEAQQAWAELARAIFNLKEFIYLK